MDKLKGSGSTFSTSGKGWLPFNHNPKLASRFARLHRLKASGLTPPTDKQALRQAAEQATAAHAITVIPQGQRTRFGHKRK